MGITRKNVENFIGKYNYINTLYGLRNGSYPIDSLRIMYNADHTYGLISCNITSEFLEAPRVSCLVKCSATNISLIKMSCFCADSRNEEYTPCNHIAALLVYIAENPDLETEELTPLKFAELNSTVKKNILFKYSVSDVMTKAEQGSNFVQKINLVPTLRSENGYFDMGLKIGSEGSKLFVIKDIVDFARCFINQEMVKYGKSTTILLHESGLNRLSKKVWDFTKKYLRDNMSTYTSVNKSFDEFILSPQSYTGLRYIRLANSHMEEFVEIMDGEEISVDGQNMSISNTNPPTSWILEKQAPDQYTLSLSTPCYTFKNYSGNIHIINNCLYKGDEDYKKEMSPILGQINQCYGKIISFSEKDLLSLCTYVLPVIKKYCRLENYVLDPEEYQVTEPECEIKLDYSEKDNSITADINFKYGDNSYPLFEPITSSQGRNMAYELNILNILTEPQDCVKKGKNKIVYNTDESNFTFLTSTLNKIMALSRVYISDSLKKVNKIRNINSSFGVSIEGSVLNLDIVTEGFDKNELAEILNAYKLKKKYYRLKDGAFVNLNSDTLGTLWDFSQGLGISPDQLTSLTTSLPLYRAFFLKEILESLSPQQIDYRSEEFIENINNTFGSQQDPEDLLPSHLTKILRPYQKEGVKWLLSLYGYKMGGILADEMGLGKTLQIISLISAVPDSTALIICPASLLYNWQMEFARFAPEIKCLAVAGNVQTRSEIIESRDSARILITSYDYFKRDIKIYQSLHFNIAVVDEAQFIKNDHTLVSKAVKIINADCRFALTGTPIENRLSDLWNIFDFIMPGFLFSYKTFKEKFEQAITLYNDNSALVNLHRLVNPFILRRLKADVLKDLPEKTEEVIYTQLEGEQKKQYDGRAINLVKHLTSQNDKEYATGKIEVLAELTRLRQLCCDPGLIYENYTAGSSKAQTCISLASSAIYSGHKVLIFSQFSSMLERLKEEFTKEGIQTFILTGSTPKEARIRMVAEFNDPENTSVNIFLISLKAGGTGLNLTAADIVIHFDPWWNYAAQNQATDRAHRIGQDKIVTVYKIIAAGTIEENVLKLQDSKKNLADKIINTEEISSSEISKELLIKLLS